MGVAGGSAVVQRGIEKTSGSGFHLEGAGLFQKFWASFKGSSYTSIDMVCFYIAVNTESGACTAPPERRGALQAASLVVQVVIWVTAGVGLVLVDSGFVEMQLIINKLTGNRSPLGGPAYSSFSNGTSYLRAVASTIFFVGNLSYLVASLILAILTLHAKLSGHHEATKRRPKGWRCFQRDHPAPLYSGWDVRGRVQHSSTTALALRSPLPTLPCPGRTQPTLHGGDGLVWPWSLLRLLPLGQKDSKPWS